MAETKRSARKKSTGKSSGGKRASTKRTSTKRASTKRASAKKSTGKRASAKKGTRRYGKAAGKSVASAMRRRKSGTLKRWKRGGGTSRTVKSRMQAIAIGLNEARAKGAKVPRKRTGGARKRSGGARSGASRKTAARKK